MTVASAGMGRQEVRAAQIQQFSLWVKPFLEHQEKTTLSTGGSRIEAIISRQLIFQKHIKTYLTIDTRNWLQNLNFMLQHSSGHLFHLQWWKNWGLVHPSPFLDMWKQPQFIMTLEFKPNLQVTTETLRPSANRSISVPTTAMADCSSKASSSLLIISTLTVFSSIIANSLINVKRKLQKINFSIGTASSAPMELYSTKPTSFATGGSTLTVQR